MTDKRKIYSSEFRDSAVQMVLSSGKSRAEVARELGIEDWRVRGWVSQARKAGTTNGVNVSVDKAEHERLKREYKRVLEENEILKKAAAFFAQHQR
jgi:transposase